MPTQTTMQLVELPIDQLQADPKNPRRISDAESETLTRSLQQFGFVQPVVARASNYVVIGGHQRLVAARRAGFTTVPVILVDVTEEQAHVLSLALNRIGGDWDEALLARLLAELANTPNVDLTLTGFDEDEVRNLLRSLEAREKRDRPEQFDVDAAYEATSTLRTQPGDLVKCGEHLVLCGDSTDSAAIERLMGGRHAEMAFTDPPYNVAYGDHGGQPRGARRRRIANDAMPREPWKLFCRAWILALLGHVDGALYVCMSSKEMPLVSHLLEELGAHWSDTLIWRKDRFTLGRADYQREYEPIWFGWREGAKHQWCGDRNQSDVWEIPRPSVSELHPTMKPLALVERALTNSSKPGDVVLDLFLGSGTTLIAAERTARICYAMELDPRYVDVAVARWEGFTGQQAVRER